MAPNSKEEKLPIIECAVPFKDEQNGSGVAKPNLVQNGNPSAFVSLRRQESREGVTYLRVNTTHRYTYELNKYRKNAMLIFHYDNAHSASSRETANKVKSTFEKFRFEVEIHHNINADKVKAVSQAFFQRDFCEYGAVGVVVIGETDDNGAYITPTSTFGDKDVLNYMTTANLKGKPKIIIFECDKIPRRHFTKVYADNDIIDYNFPSVAVKSNYLTSPDPNSVYNPLSIFCDQMDTLADQESLDTILNKVVDEAKNKNWKWPPS